ncbi:hypothetical protein Pelo_488 [Pelomyxa schiedti]|nr:hypothetical protein Pelo_488 [Pelomyxa schiedti]
MCPCVKPSEIFSTAQAAASASFSVIWYNLAVGFGLCQGSRQYIIGSIGAVANAVFNNPKARFSFLPQWKIAPFFFKSSKGAESFAKSFTNCLYWGLNIIDSDNFPGIRSYSTLSNNMPKIDREAVAGALVSPKGMTLNSYSPERVRNADFALASAVRLEPPKLSSISSMRGMGKQPSW